MSLIRLTGEPSMGNVRETILFLPPPDNFGKLMGLLSKDFLERLFDILSKIIVGTLTAVIAHLLVNPKKVSKKKNCWRGKSLYNADECTYRFHQNPFLRLRFFDRG
jgi:hypothetical protein